MREEKYLQTTPMLDYQTESIRGVLQTRHGSKD